jgi:hypothetical protein
MPTKNEMTIDERRKYVKLMAERVALRVWERVVVRW